MDKIKEQLAVAMKYGFWIGSAVVFLGSLGVWFMTTSKLSDENASQTSKINQAISTVSSVEGELSTHPNAISHEKMEALIEKRQQEVLESWKTLYDRQRDILTWPEEELTKNFVDEFRDLIPIEVFVEFPTLESDEKEITLLATYQRYIKKSLPGIAEIAKAEWTAEFESAGGGGMGMDMGMGMGMDMGMEMGMGMGPMASVGITGAVEGPLVKWPQASQSSLLSDLFPWRGSLPSTLEVYYSQENLWVLKQLLQIVAKVNGDATQPYQAQIHEISKIAIGRSVKAGAGTISKPGANASMGMGMGMGMDDMGMDDMDMMGMEMGMEMGMGMGMEMEGDGVDPAENRYVDVAGEKIDAASLRSALTTDRPDNVALAVAKRVPVMMSLKMNQRAVPELLAVCGSVPLMVHVNQVRILPANASATSGGGGMEEMGMGMDSGMGMEMGMDSGMGMGMGMGGMGGGAPTAPVAEFPLDMTVEIYGLIFIYNPPDPAKLALDQVNKDNVDELIDAATGVPAGADANGELPVPQADGDADGADPEVSAAPVTPATDVPEPSPAAPTPAAPVPTDPAAGAAPPAAASP
ncbi:MAG: hypothetical protein WBD31_30280 [Rubripirellula sp.]